MELDDAKAEQFTGARSSALFWVVTPAVIATRVSGHVDRAALDFYTQRVDRLLARGQTLQVFHDWQGITSFESDVRGPYRDWAADKETLIKPTFLVKSRVLAMALGVSALVLGRELKVIMEVADFARQLDRAVRDSRSSPPGR